MRLLLLGADGQLGFELHRSLAPLGVISPTTRSGTLAGGGAAHALDLTDGRRLEALIAEVRPDWIINAAAYTAVDTAETERDLAGAVNGHALAVIGRSARAVGARVLHYSTDYVFDGSAERPYVSDDRPAPVNAYGASKLLGEELLLASGAPHLIVRTAWVYAARGRNFLRTMLRLGREREALRVVADQFGAPTSARLIAAASAAMLARMGTAPADDPRFGLYHLTASGRTSWHGFAQAIIERAHAQGLLARAPVVEAISSAEFPTAAARPASSLLDCRALEQAFGLTLPAWQDDLARVLGEYDAPLGKPSPA